MWADLAEGSRQGWALAGLLRSPLSFPGTPPSPHHSLPSCRTFSAGTGDSFSCPFQVRSSPYLLSCYCRCAAGSSVGALGFQNFMQLFCQNVLGFCSGRVCVLLKKFTEQKFYQLCCHCIWKGGTPAPQAALLGLSGEAGPPTGSPTKGSKGDRESQSAETLPLLGSRAGQAPPKLPLSGPPT